LQGELEENHPFVQQIKDDEELAMEVEVRRLIPDAVVDYRLMSVEKLVASKRTEFLAQDSFKWQKLFWALPVVLIGTISYFILSEPKEEVVVVNEKETAKELVLIPQQEKIHQPETVQAKKQVGESNQIIKSKEVIGSTDEVKNEPTRIIEENPFVEFEGTKQKPAVQIEEKVIVAQQEAVTTPSNPCFGVRMKAYVEERRPCKGAEDGYLNLKDIRGGKAPYQFSINKQRFQEERHFAGLKSGEYDVLIKDANDCETVVYEKYELKSKNCSQAAEHVFNPYVGMWDVPNDLDKAGELDVFDKTGQRIFIKHFDKSEKITWSGTANSGELLLPGVYIYSINYSDGVVEQGRITITY
jgi:hypothetical protein